MKSFFLFLVVVSVLVSSGCVSSSASANSYFSFREQKYLDTMLSGWHIKVNLSLLENNKTVTNQTMDFLASELTTIAMTVPPDALNFLRDIPIWLEQPTKGNVTIQYHHDAGWLKDNGYDPRKLGAMEIAAVDFFNRKGKDTLVLLPAFAFAYVFRVMGNHNKTMYNAYENAKLTELYTLQDYTNKDDKRFRMRNAENYFAVVSQAYFGALNDTPHNRKELETYDPVGYKMVEELWKIKK